MGRFFLFHFQRSFLVVRIPLLVKLCKAFFLFLCQLLRQIAVLISLSFFQKFQILLFPGILCHTAFLAPFLFFRIDLHDLILRL